MERLKENLSTHENHPPRAGFFLKEQQTLLEYPTQVLYPGGSLRRTAFIKHTFNNCNVENVPIGEEPNECVEKVVEYKIGEGRKYLNEDVCSVIIAADIQTIIPQKIGNDIIEVNNGKPGSIREVYDSFAKIFSSSRRSNTEPYYKVDAASALLHKTKTKETLITEKDSCTINLDLPSLYYLLHPNGFQKYLEEFDKFYSSSAYTKNGMKKISPLDISGGVSLPVLTKMGAVRSIQGVGIEDETFHDTLKKNIHLVAVGISPKLLNAIHLDTSRIMRDWSWLNEVSKNVMGTL